MKARKLYNFGLHMALEQLKMVLILCLEMSCRSSNWKNYWHATYSHLRSSTSAKMFSRLFTFETARLLIQVARLLLET